MVISLMLATLTVSPTVRVLLSTDRVLLSTVFISCKCKIHTLGSAHFSNVSSQNNYYPDQIIEPFAPPPQQTLFVRHAYGTGKRKAKESFELL